MGRHVATESARRLVPVKTGAPWRAWCMALALVCAGSGYARAADAAGNGIVEVAGAAAVQAMLERVSVVDARDAASFRAGHVPGAQPMPWDEWTEEKPGAVNLVVGTPSRWGRAPGPSTSLAERLRTLGLSNGRTIVVVGQPGEWGDEGRVAWNLLYWGADRVILLDGGFPAWRSDPTRPVETGGARSIARGDFRVRERTARRATFTETRTAAAQGRRLLDARTREEFSGKTMTGQARGGHIPGALLVPATSLYAADGSYVDAARLRLLVADVKAAERPLAYCTGGVRSALLALLVEARLGVLVANYDASLWEYAAVPDAPLSTEPASP